MKSFTIAHVWHDRRRNYGSLLFPPFSFVTVHLDSLVNSCRLLVWHPRVTTQAHLLVLGPAFVGPFFFARSPADHIERPAAASKTCSSPPALRSKRGNERPNLPPKTQCRPNAHARPYRPENSPHRVTETASRAPRTAYGPRQPPRLGGPRRPAAAPGGLVNRFTLNALPADSPHRAVFSASPKIRHDAHASYPQISLGPFFQRVGKVVMMRTQAPRRLPSGRFFSGFGNPS